MSVPLSQKYQDVTTSTDDVSSARILLLHHQSPVLPQPQHRQRRLKKQPPSGYMRRRPVSPLLSSTQRLESSPFTPRRSVSLPLSSRQPVSIWTPHHSSFSPIRSSAYQEYSGSSTATYFVQEYAGSHSGRESDSPRCDRSKSLSEGPTFGMSDGNSWSSILRAGGVGSAITTRDGKLVKQMGPGESRPLTAVALHGEDDEGSGADDYDHSPGGWTRKWGKIRGLLRR